MLVRRANVVLEVEDYEVEKFYKQGYDVLDANGSILKKAVPTSVGALQKEYRQHIEEIKTLKAQIETLQNELSILKNSKVEKEQAEEPKPKTTRTRKKSTPKEEPVSE